MKSLALTAFFMFVLLFLPGATRGADVAYFGIVKAIQFEQTNNSAPVLLPTNAFSFNSFVVGATNYSVTNATVKPATSPLITLVPDPTGLALLFTEEFQHQTNLDDSYPAGTLFNPANYTVTMYTTNDGVRTATLNFFLIFLPVSYPATPQVANFAEAQSIDDTKNFTLQWNSLGGTSLTIVQLTIQDAHSNIVFTTPAPFQNGALNGTSTSAIIPAYALGPATNLYGHLSIANPGTPNTNAYPGAIGVPALAKDTEFTLTTRPSPAAPTLTALRTPGDQFRLRLEGEPNRLFQIQASTNLATWVTLFTTNCQTGTFDYIDPTAAGVSWRFYRGKVGQ